MKGRWLWIVIGANLLVLVALAFVYPQLMVAPGPLMPGHAALTADCFACHTALRGATTERCVACHVVPDIGLRTTRGVPIQATKTRGATPLKVSFHQQLSEGACAACHSDHAGPRLNQHNRKTFSHALLRAATRDRCETCHAAPSDALHRNVSTGCAQCHASQAWKPATFEHDSHFVLDRDHAAPCATCHLGDDYGKYTCYGCHEHTPAKIRAKHVEEGIASFENCVECHRSAHEEPKGRGDRKRPGRD